MRCTHCGAIIPDDMLWCPECGMEVQIVPDYNPLEDVLAQEVKGSVEDATRQIRTDDIRRYRREGSREYSNSTRVLSQGELDEIRARRNAAMRQGRREGRNTTGSMRQSARGTTGNMRQASRNTTGSIRQDRADTGSMRRQATGTIHQRSEAEERRRQQIARKKRLAKKRRQRALIIFLLLIILAGVLGFVYYQNSYEGQIRKGNQALQSSDYSLAESYYKKAINKSSKKAEAYTGLSKVYIQQDDLEEAETVFTTAIASQPSNVELYKAAIQFYVDTKQLLKISELLADCEYDEVLEGVKDYVSKEPQFSLEEGTYEEVQQVTLSSDGGTIYYTDDGSEPDTSSKKYTEPILLKEEGSHVIKAITVNKKKVPSLTAARTYVIQLPIADAPSVTPSTGQYETASKITITVPEGYTAYYTTDNTDPTDPAVTPEEYTGPIDMPEGQTMFSAVLKNNNTGKYTQVTKRNYMLEITQ
ncbi:chitobiase/beta-hexosaminidase C-terminal domain-containing protein [Faecalicatena sp. AGMB00832]|uniref:Chitobiase/beta-hexosaminidase C-terminal domain-containing protein n=1 Tax=Faecalicatena faecalis TaxID=2726362 RepID=A0ABS6D434_9FIRM|nr:chitobiase/beta-hexosaminidase C-terminal domain-containing protein [Faecalicatena faecalis]MBU3876352.1 chitobiase/beta-hexosaminidase C-terminal domain-containing protein [Faecalicatena faecalis]